MKNLNKIPLTVLTAAILIMLLGTQGFAQYKSDPPQFKVKLDFNRWHDYDELKADIMKLVKAYPKFLKYRLIDLSRIMPKITNSNPG